MTPQARFGIAFGAIAWLTHDRRRTVRKDTERWSHEENSQGFRNDGAGRLADRLRPVDGLVPQDPFRPQRRRAGRPGHRRGCLALAETIGLYEPRGRGGRPINLSRAARRLSDRDSTTWIGRPSPGIRQPYPREFFMHPFPIETHKTGSTIPPNR